MASTTLFLEQSALLLRLLLLQAAVKQLKAGIFQTWFEWRTGRSSNNNALVTAHTSSPPLVWSVRESPDAFQLSNCSVAGLSDSGVANGQLAMDAGMGPEEDEDAACR
ncbi:hypothetical protein GUJ93_ZPchr0008g13704 [Zizania palustris]|uniref:Uncharacterized protein n=1 Tax=Zizania palustris TaxID=103762 RepID=A0A8J5VGK9_ZIZPA|nr:hypothetical protein GUJ93_ZPchr0008g13704 [Zizania palustris]